jgi:hypothetical protein
MKTITRTINDVGVWLTEYADPAGLRSDDDVRFARTITFSTNDMRDCGWTRVGTATVTVELVDEKSVIESKVDSLQKQLQKERADSEVKCNRILEQISKLQALEYTA